MVNVLIEDVKDIFGIPKKTSINDTDDNDVDDEILDNLTVSKLSFNEKLTDLKEKIAKTDLSGLINLKNEKITEINTETKETIMKKIDKTDPLMMDDILEKDPEKVINKAIIDAKNLPKEKQMEFSDGVFDKLEQSINEKSIEDVKKESPVEKTKEFSVEKALEIMNKYNEEKTEKSKKVDILEDTIDINSIIPNAIDNSKEINQIQEQPEQKQEVKYSVINFDEWNLNPPTPEFEKFYSDKKDTLKHIINDRIPFKKYTKELIDAKVDVTTPLLDFAEIHKKMQLVQGFRDRVKDIRIHCSSQYFKVKMFLETFKGKLLTIRTVKPAEAREGYFFEHLSDVMDYQGDLEHIHYSADIVYKNLDNAFECLSRQLSIALPNRPIERMGSGPNIYDPTKTEKNENTLLKTIEIEDIKKKEELKDFDVLDSNNITIETTKEEKNYAKQITWGDIKPSKYK